VSGISKGLEAEQRATSALLSVLKVVRPFSRSLLSPVGASRAANAKVESFIEVSFKSAKGKQVRPDGLIRVSYGSAGPWVALVEVKTGRDRLDADQINSYFDVALANGYDCVITISNELESSPGVHPCSGLKVRSNSRAKVHHFSWSGILAEAVKQKQHRGVDDPEQAWILGELIRYLKHDSSGAMTFDDMGQVWAEVRDGAREGSLSPRSEAVGEVAQLWDQLLGYAAVKLGSDIGHDVHEILPRKHRDDPTLRSKEFVRTLCEAGTLAGVIRVPNTAGDIDIIVDLKARQVVVGAEIVAPDDRGAKARVSWIARQLANANPQIVIESYAKNTRLPEVAYLAQVLEDSTTLAPDTKKPPVKFRLVSRTEMGLNRKTGKKIGFIDSVINAVEHFYSTVLQDVTAYQPKAAKIEKPTAHYLSEDDQAGMLPAERIKEIEVTEVSRSAEAPGWTSQ
jgi:hypothetical protein